MRHILLIMLILFMGTDDWAQAAREDGKAGKQCFALLEEVKVCKTDEDCLISDAGCEPCQCFTAINRAAGTGLLEKIKKLRTEWTANIVCEACYPIPPRAVCEENRCGERYDDE